MEMGCFYQIIRSINDDQLSRSEKILLEVELFLKVYNELKEIYKEEYQDYFDLLKFNREMKHMMIENNFIRSVINDILLTEEYTLPGIAYYTQTNEDVIYELAMGQNNNPSFSLTRKILELHRLVRKELYEQIFHKIMQK